jgi:hypothetical protein
MGVFQNVMPTEVAISPRAQISNQRRVCTQVLFLHKAAELGFFHFLEIVTGLVGSCYLPARQKIPVQPGRYLPPHKIPLAGNKFLQAGKRTENTKDKIQAELSVLTTIFSKDCSNSINPLVCIQTIQTVPNFNSDKVVVASLHTKVGVGSNFYFYFFQFCGNSP